MLYCYSVKVTLVVAFGAGSLLVIFKVTSSLPPALAMANATRVLGVVAVGPVVPGLSLLAMGAGGFAGASSGSSMISSML